MPAPPPFPGSGGMVADPQAAANTPNTSSAPPPFPVAAAPGGGGNAPPPFPSTGGMVVNPPSGAQQLPGVPSWGQGLEHGLLESVHDVTDWPAEELASGVGAAVHGLGFAPNWHPGADTRAQDIANEQAFNQQYGSSLPAAVGRFGGDIAGATAAVASGEGVLDALGQGVSRAIPAAAPYVANAGRFLAGAENSSPLGKLAAMVTRGAAEGAAGNEAIQGTTGPTGQAAVQGAAIGAAAGPLAWMVGKGVSLTGRLVRAAFGSIADTPETATTNAARDILGRLKADNITPEEAILRLKAMGPDATLADLPGENLQQMAEGLANKPGFASQMARTVYEGRADSAEERITQAIQNVTGQQGNTVEAGADLTAARSKASGPLYKALENLVPSPQQIEQLQPFITSTKGQAAMHNAMNTLEMDAIKNGQKFNPAAYGIGRDADGKLIVMPGYKSVPLLHAIKEGFDDLVEGYRDPATHQLPKTKEVNALDDFRKSFRNRVADMFPEYKAALNAWSGPSSAMDAQRMGALALKNDPAVTTQAIKNLSDSDKAFFLNGVARTMLDKIEGNAESASDARTLLRNTAMRKRLMAALGSNDAWGDFEEKLEREIKFADNKNRFLRGSPTARRVANHITDLMPYVMRAASGDIPGAVLDMAREEAFSRLTENESANLARGRLLFTPDAADEIADALNAAQPGLFKKGLAVAGQAARRSIAPGAAATFTTVTRQPPSGG